MEFTDYMIWKALAIVAGAFVWGLYRGFTGRPLWPEHRDRTGKEQD